MSILSSNSLVAGRYLLKRRIGGGGMGAVWLAEHVELRAPCALKLIEGEAAAQNPEFRRRFMREARAAALLRSPHVVQVLDSGEWRGQPYLAMELLEGEDLGACLLRTRRLPPGDCVEIARQIARALAKAHAAAIVHRDLKPANVFLSRDDDRLVVKVLDFGIAKYDDAEPECSTDNESLLGTPHYMSPEQCRAAGEVDFRSDLWSLAVIVFECLTGTRPFPGPTLVNLVHQIAVGEMPLPSAVRRELPEAVDAWWLRAVRREPAERFGSAREMVEALAQALDLPAVPASSADPSVLAGGRYHASSAPPLAEPTVPHLRPRASSPWLQTLPGTGSLPPGLGDALPPAAPPPVRYPCAADLPTKASGFRFANGEAVTRPSAKLARASSVPPSCRSVPASAALDSVTPPGHTASARSLADSGARRRAPRAFEGMRGLGLLAVGAAGFFAFGTTVSRLAPNQASAGGTPPAGMTSAPLLSDVAARPAPVDATPPSTHAAPAPTAAPADATPPSRQGAPADATPPSPHADPAPASAPADVATPPAQGAASPSVTRGALAQPRALKPRRPLTVPASNAARAASAPGVGGRASAPVAPSKAAGISPARSTLRNDEPESAN